MASKPCSHGPWPSLSVCSGEGCLQGHVYIHCCITNPAFSSRRSQAGCHWTSTSTFSRECSKSALHQFMGGYPVMICQESAFQQHFAPIFNPNCSIAYPATVAAGRTVCLGLPPGCWWWAATSPAASPAHPVAPWAQVVLVGSAWATLLRVYLRVAEPWVRA